MFCSSLLIYKRQGEHFQCIDRLLVSYLRRYINACKSVNCENVWSNLFITFDITPDIFVPPNILRLAFTSDGVRVGVESGVVNAYDPAGENQIMEGQARRNWSYKNLWVSTFLQSRLLFLSLSEKAKTRWSESQVEAEE